MPELHLKDLRFPELRMPEMTRDDIAKTLGEARKELGDVRRELGDMRRDIDLSRIDVPKAVSDAATSVGQSVGLVKRPRSRLPLVAGAIVTVGLVGWAVRSSPSLKSRIQGVVQAAREWMDGIRSSTDDMESQAFDAAVTMPVEPSVYADDLASSDSPFDGPTDLPKGLGTNGAHGAADGTESLVDVSRS